MRSIQTPVIDSEAIAIGQVVERIIDVSNFSAVGFQWVQHTAGGDIASIEFAVTLAPDGDPRRRADMFDTAYEAWVTDPRFYFTTLPTGSVEGSLPLQINCPTYTAIKVKVTGGAAAIDRFSIFFAGKAGH